MMVEELFVPEKYKHEILYLADKTLNITEKYVM